MEASANITAVTVTADASDRTRAAATRTPISNVGDTMLEHLSNPLQPKAETSSTQRALFTPSLVKTRKSARRESSSGATAQLGIGFDAEAAAANSSSLRVPVDFKSVSNRSSAWRSASVNHSTGSVFDVHTIGTLDAALILSGADRADDSQTMVEDDVHCLNVDGMGLNAVHEADVARFSNLRELSANDNMLPFRPLGKLPQIKSLSLACNSILELGNLAGRFEHLETLDLSFNRLRSTAINLLATLPKLRMLNVMNNEIELFPRTDVVMDLSTDDEGGATRQIGFPNLEVLNLENNRIKSTDGESLKALGRLPRLKKLNISSNHLTSFDVFRSRTENFVFARMYRGFEKLEELNVTNNHFQSGHDFIGVIGLPALKRIWLQGNTFIKRLVLENRVHEFSELISELQDMHKIRVMDMHYGEYGGKESRGLAYVGKVLSRRRKREMRMEQFEDNNVPVTKPHTVQEVYPKSPSRLTEDNLSRILNEKSGTKNGRKTISKVNLDNLLPTERNLWKVAGVQVDDIGKTPGTVSTRHTTATISKYTSTGVSADATFLTGVDIETSAQNKKMETLIRNAPAVISFDWEKGLDFNGEELDQYELDLPSTIQGSIKALRRVLANPEYYWCLAEKSFVHETMSSNIKKNLKHAELRDWLKKERRDMHKSKGNLRDVESLMNKLDRKLAFMDRRLSSIISDPSLTSSHPVLETSINNVKSQLKDLQTILLQSTDGEEVTANAASTTTA